MIKPLAMMVAIALGVMTIVAWIGRAKGGGTVDDGQRTTPRKHIRLTRHNRVAIGVRCTECNYDLRNRPLDSCCPECDTPVAVAIREGHHVRILRRRAWITAALIGGAVLLVAAAFSM